MSSSNESSGSRAIASEFRIGIPRKCWCGARVVTFTSKTSLNPYRRFFRCGEAKWDDKGVAVDEHIFKWVDEALFEEIKLLEMTQKTIIADLEELKQNVRGNMEDTKKLIAAVPGKCEGKHELQQKKTSSESMKNFCMISVVLCILGWFFM